MAYRIGNRTQMGFLPQSIEDYIAKDDPVRAYDVFVEALDFKELGIELDPSKVGNSEYDPKVMLKLLVYGYSYGIRSSRRLERETRHNMSFIWLMGGLKPDHKTIAEFRRKHKEVLQNVLKKCARMCIKLDLIAGNVLFVDSTRIRANASASRTHNKAWYEEQLGLMDQRIDQLLQECETSDQHEADLDSFVAMQKELVRSDNLKSAIKDVLSKFKKTPRQKINQTDPDCANMSSIHGKHASYNVQSVVDEKNGLIVHAEPVGEGNDLHQFASQIDQANEVLGKNCETACADAGYADTDELEKIDAKGIKVIVPSQRQALHKGAKPFSKQEFRYDKARDCYYCPEGHNLTYQSTYHKTGNRYYMITKKSLCDRCQHLGICTTGKRGRRLVRLHNEAVKEKLETHYEQEESQTIYAKRKDRAEHPFGHMKRNLKIDSFLLRGRRGVQAETSLIASCFNIVRMISILGVSQMIRKLPTIMTLAQT